jgi:uncharacterized membrane protein YhfC
MCDLVILPMGKHVKKISALILQFTATFLVQNSETTRKSLFFCRFVTHDFYDVNTQLLSNEYLFKFSLVDKIDSFVSCVVHVMC